MQSIEYRTSKRSSPSPSPSLRRRSTSWP
uniref:Uncharacterized protein n=1 Tax=Arundo donax TaxID=35708 RepID=A0A0A8ZQ03_ARUDO